MKDVAMLREDEEARVSALTAEVARLRKVLLMNRDRFAFLLDDFRRFINPLAERNNLHQFNFCIQHCEEGMAEIAAALATEEEK